MSQEQRPLTLEENEEELGLRRLSLKRAFYNSFVPSFNKKCVSCIDFPTFGGTYLGVFRHFSYLSECYYSRCFLVSTEYIFELMEVTDIIRRKSEECLPVTMPYDEKMEGRVFSTKTIYSENSERTKALLLLTRKHCLDSFFSEEKLPLDIFKEIFKFSFSWGKKEDKELLAAIIYEFVNDTPIIGGVVLQNPKYSPVLNWKNRNSLE